MHQVLLDMPVSVQAIVLREVAALSTSEKAYRDYIGVI